MNTSPNGERCDQCKFWVRMGGAESLTGRCHRFPPQMINAAMARFPADVGQDQWCGEFSIREAPKAAVAPAKVKK